ncbi:hypothetical protein B0H16DRAFT_1468369 [Mycena metata]|uniref:Uncharacterized protein n=1 Tax=Mycena metata TaxID=1033252 RepID=A0AAD7I161_9AGAR|nr:hypothetical protein B0H16DRAFT_1468369 [Mycena metata]
MAKSFVRLTSPFAALEPPPPAVVQLLIQTDLNAPTFTGLLIHKDLNDLVPPAKKRVVFATTPHNSYPPPSILPDTIPPPPGLTRHTLENHDAWTIEAAETAVIKTTVHNLADAILDTTKCITDEDKKLLDQVYQEAAQMHPLLREYQGNWATNCILQAHLKITTQAAKKMAEAKEAEQLLAAANEVVAKRHSRLTALDRAGSVTSSSHHRRQSSAAIPSLLTTLTTARRCTSAAVGVRRSAPRCTRAGPVKPILLNTSPHPVVMRYRYSSAKNKNLRWKHCSSQCILTIASPHTALCYSSAKDKNNNDQAFAVGNGNGRNGLNTSPPIASSGALLLLASPPLSSIAACAPPNVRRHEEPSPTKVRIVGGPQRESYDHAKEMEAYHKEQAALARQKQTQLATENQQIIAQLQAAEKMEAEHAARIKSLQHELHSKSQLIADMQRHEGQLEAQFIGDQEKLRELINHCNTMVPQILETQKLLAQRNDDVKRLNRLLLQKKDEAIQLRAYNYLQGKKNTPPTKPPPRRGTRASLDFVHNSSTRTIEIPLDPVPLARAPLGKANPKPKAKLAATPELANLFGTDVDTLGGVPAALQRRAGAHGDDARGTSPRNAGPRAAPARGPKQFLQTSYRIKTITAAIDIKRDKGIAVDIATWERLLEMLELLGEQGMSSEEEDEIEANDKKMIVYMVKLCVRCEPRIVDYLRLVDKQTALFKKRGRDQRDQRGQRGPPPHTRVRTDVPGSSKVPRGLPMSLYNGEWLKAATPAYVKNLKISKEAFGLFVAAVDRMAI